MISSIKGTPKIENGTLTVETASGLGFELTCTNSTLANANENATDQTFLTYLQVREDGVYLYGFSKKEEKAMFEKLITISGIGPKLAIGILSGINSTDLAVAIATGDVKTISSIKGLGKKTAERIVLELKEQMSKASANLPEEAMSFKAEDDQVTDAIFALNTLGFKTQDITRTISQVYKQGMKAEEIIKLSLKGLGK